MRIYVSICILCIHVCNLMYTNIRLDIFSRVFGGCLPSILSCFFPSFNLCCDLYIYIYIYIYICICVCVCVCVCVCLCVCICVFFICVHSCTRIYILTLMYILKYINIFKGNWSVYCMWEYIWPHSQMYVCAHDLGMVVCVWVCGCVCACVSVCVCEYWVFCVWWGCLTSL